MKKEREKARRLLQIIPASLFSISYIILPLPQAEDKRVPIITEELQI